LHILPLKTPTLCAVIGATYGQIVSAIRGGKLTPPAKDTSGDYYWLPADVERARLAVATDRRRKGQRTRDLVGDAARAD
jgi:hypothetical protein